MSHRTLESGVNFNIKCIGKLSGPTNEFERPKFDCICVFRVCLCYTILSVPCSFAVTCWERAELLALLCVKFSCAFVTFPYGVLGQVWYLMVLIPDLCLLPYFGCYIPVFSNGVYK